MPRPPISMPTNHCLLTRPPICASSHRPPPPVCTTVELEFIFPYPKPKSSQRRASGSSAAGAGELSASAVIDTRKTAIKRCVTSSIHLILTAKCPGCGQPLCVSQACASRLLWIFLPTGIVRIRRNSQYSSRLGTENQYPQSRGVIRGRHHVIEFADCFNC